MIKLHYIGTDYWGCPVYKDQNDKLWKDTNLGDGEPSLYSSSNNEIDGEPDHPINIEHEFITKYEKNPNSSNYLMLGRLRSDCDYYLGHGRRCEKYISGKNGVDTISEMKKLWNGFPADSKPERLTMEDIEEYEREMITPSGKYDDPYAWGEYRRSKRVQI